VAANPLIDATGLRIRRGSYAIASATALGNPRLLPVVQDYRRQSSGRMMPLDREDMHRRLPAARYHVSRKIDGEFTALYIDSDNVFTLNPGGTVRMGLPWQAEAESLLQKHRSGIGQLVIAGEMYAETGGRARVHDVISLLRHPESDDDLDRVRFAAFDIIEMDGKPHEAAFAETW
jgi:hypothetical protein